MKKEERSILKTWMYQQAQKVRGKAMRQDGTAMFFTPEQAAGMIEKIADKIFEEHHLKVQHFKQRAAWREGR